MKKIAILLSVVILLLVGGLSATASGDYPPLQDGDLIFLTSTSSQSSAILVATADPYTHMGIIKNNGDQFVVVEAKGVVKETPLDEWIERGVLSRMAIYRKPILTLKQADQIIAATRKYYGKPYDIFFSFTNDAIYCSELPYLAYKEAGLDIGKVQKVSELNFDNALVRKLIEQRWERHHECKVKGYDFKQCYAHILRQDLVTPASIASDPQFEQIFSNYPF